MTLPVYCDSITPVPWGDGRMAQLVEHFVHIEGVTGSSPVATTMKRKKLYFFLFFFSELALGHWHGLNRRIIRVIEYPSAFPTPPVYMLFFQKFFSLYGQFPCGRIFCPEVSYGRSTRHLRGGWMAFLITLLTGNQNNQLQHDIVE